MTSSKRVSLQGSALLFCSDGVLVFLAHSQRRSPSLGAKDHVRIYTKVCYSLETVVPDFGGICCSRLPLRTGPEDYLALRRGLASTRDDGLPDFVSAVRPDVLWFSRSLGVLAAGQPIFFETTPFRRGQGVANWSSGIILCRLPACFPLMLDHSLERTSTRRVGSLAAGERRDTFDSNVGVGEMKH
ncbi:hypothetical protein Cflav_PD0907 [Pedosphaera parvula Ellin514]|uniref:Uncharacterized protein n=1 Tax=Pedosphaera parvula (strain Ellin514) TaxID=320771 RepID=B9XQV0_PEDPL|nr:hypothetical protein Cflav_PD0907 [Pedosphaera parvula Ellin514]